MSWLFKSCRRTVWKFQNLRGSQTGKQTITVRILLDISKGKGNQAMKFGNLIEYNLRNIFLQKSYKKRNRETSSRSLSEKALYEVKESGQHLSFNIFWKFSAWTCNKHKLYKVSDYWSRHMHNFDYLEKGLGLISPPHFVYNLSEKIFLISYFIN